MFQAWEPSNDFPTLGDLVKRGYTIFDDSWDTHVKEHKKTLCDKIIRYYWFNQIGAETPDRFLWYINEQLARIMPYYNQLYASELIKFDPMLNHSLTSNGRSIENLLKAVKSDNVRTNKVLRDFISENTAFGSTDANTGVKSSENVDKTVETVYNKDGTDDATTTTDETQHETADTWTTTKENRDKATHETVTSNLVGNDTGHSVTITDSDKQTTDKKDINIGIVEDATTKDTGTVVDDGVGTSKSTGSKDWTETRDDTAKTTVVTGLTESTDTTSRKDYADTPQIQLVGGSTGSSGSASAGLPQVRADYLTNVTWDYSHSDHKLDSTVNTDFKDDETKTHTEATSDNTDTTNKNTQTTDRTKKGDTTTTTDHIEDNTGSETVHSTSTTNSSNDRTENVNKSTDGTEKITADIVQHSNTNTDTTTHGTEVYDDDWTEKGTQKELTKSTRTATQDTAASSKSKETKSGRENMSEEGGSTGLSKEDTTRTTDTGKTDITTGYMNIPSSALLEAFRKTFLNIDQRIIDDLRENFLSVF